MNPPSQSFGVAGDPMLTVRWLGRMEFMGALALQEEIGRASCRERVLDHV